MNSNNWMETRTEDGRSWFYRADGYPVDGLNEISVRHVDGNWWVGTGDDDDSISLIKDPFRGGSLIAPLDDVETALAMAQILIERQMREGRNAERQEWGEPFGVRFEGAHVCGRFRGAYGFEVCLYIGAAACFSIDEPSTWEAVCCKSPAIFARLAAEHLEKAGAALRLALGEGAGRLLQESGCE